jgi:hypothetical protein
METLSIDSAKPFSFELIQRALSQVWRVEVSNADTLIVHGVGSRVYIHSELTSNTSGRRRLMLDYSDVDLVKSVVERIADDPDIMVDNDFGTILPGDQFVARIKAEVGWNWRS